MKRILIFLTLIIVSFYFFPLGFNFFPTMNTKMMLAAVGIFIFLWGLINSKNVAMSSEVFVATIIACIFTLICFYAITINNTNDLTYATYVVNMWVWLGGAYTVCYTMARVHGYISMKLVMNYLIGLCALQCLMALIIDNSAFVRYLVESNIAGYEKRSEGGRLYGIGAAVDIAGTRFSAILSMIAVLLSNDNAIKTNKKQIVMYVMMFIFITVVGSMISRTTNIGAVVAIVYIIYATGELGNKIKLVNMRLWSMLIGITMLILLFCIYLYNNVPAAHSLFRFGFEGLINWLETGTWSTKSTDMLQTMWVFPDSIKTWIIGDGYFVDPNHPGSFYMMTDIGYCRFIFYCGLTGLFAFSMLFVYVAFALYRRFPEFKHLFLLLLLLEFIIWSKVATDIFLVFALFLCIPMIQIHHYYRDKKILREA